MRVSMFKYTNLVGTLVSVFILKNRIPNRVGSTLKNMKLKRKTGKRESRKE